MDILSDLILLIIVFCIGFFLGANMLNKSNYDGVMYVNLEDPNDDIFRLSIDIAPGEIPMRKDLLFKVENVNSRHNHDL